MKKIAILASGEGTNAERIIRYFLEKRTAEVALVIVNKAQAGVLKRAERLSVPSLILTAQDFADGKALEILHQYHIDFIVLAGFLLKVPDAILHDYPNKIVNIHPALLPKFGVKGMYGSRVHQAVLFSKKYRIILSALVIVNKAQAGVLKRAERLSVPSQIGRAHV